jgi:hypothetical protein
MSTVTVQTISNGTVSTSSANVIQGSAKAWLNYNPNSSTIKASYNVSSVTVNSTANFTINFTNNLADANYAVGSFANYPIGAQMLVSSSTTDTKTNSAFQFSTVNSATGSLVGTGTDVGIVILR